MQSATPPGNDHERLYERVDIDHVVVITIGETTLVVDGSRGTGRRMMTERLEHSSDGLALEAAAGASAPAVAEVADHAGAGPKATRAKGTRDAAGAAQDESAARPADAGTDGAAPECARPSGSWRRSTCGRPSSI